MGVFEPPTFGENPKRREAPGEAAVRLASWWQTVWGLLGVKFYLFEQKALQKVAGAYIRRWPKLARWKALDK